MITPDEVFLMRILTYLRYEDEAEDGDDAENEEAADNSPSNIF